MKSRSYFIFLVASKIAFSTNLDLFWAFLQFFDHILTTFFIKLWDFTLDINTDLESWLFGLSKKVVALVQKKNIIEAARGKSDLWPNIWPIFQMLVYLPDLTKKSPCSFLQVPTSHTCWILLKQAFCKHLQVPAAC